MFGVRRGLVAASGLAWFIGCGQAPSFASRQGTQDANGLSGDDPVVGPVEGNVATGVDAAVSSDDQDQSAQGSPDEPGGQSNPVGSGVDSDPGTAPADPGHPTEVEVVDPTGTTVEQDPNDNEENPNPGREPELDPGPIVREVITQPGQTVTVDSFLLPRSVPVTQTLSNDRMPLRHAATTQDLGAAHAKVHSILGPGHYTKTIYRAAPLARAIDHQLTHVGQPLDLFVTVDDSESFSLESIARTKTAILKLLADVYDTDWVLYLGGLEGLNGAFDKAAIGKGSLSLADAQAAASQALDAIFETGSNGDERVIRSLNLLAYEYRNVDRDSALHAYFIVTDAPNCKDRQNEESSDCSRIDGRSDYHKYLQFTSTLVPTPIRAHMTMVGAYYRQTDNLAVCGSTDKVEIPLDTESFKLNSQYAEMSFLSEKSITPSLPTTNDPAWVGNLCAVTEDLTFLSSFADAVKHTLARRSVLPDTPDVFSGTDAAPYNLKVAQDDATIVAADQWEQRSSVVMVYNDALLGKVTALYHKANNYRRTEYLDILDPRPEPGTLTITWAGASALTCANLANFSNQPAAVVCRHWDNDLYVRSGDVLPRVAPGAPDLAIEVGYDNHVDLLRELVVQGPGAIYADTLAVTQYPPEAAELVAQAVITQRAGTSQAEITFPSTLPPGDYTVSWYDVGQAAGHVTLPTAAEPGDTNVRCYLPGAEAAMDQSGAIVITPSEAIFPCALDGTGAVVSYSERVPVNPASGRRDLEIVYRGVVEPVSLVGLNYPPRNGEVLASVASIDAPEGLTPLGGDTYTVAANQVLLVNPLQPGFLLRLDYVFEPPLDACYPLSSTADGTNPYIVWYGPQGSEVRLATGAYTVAAEGGKLQVCLPAAQLVHGYRVIVGYVSAPRSLD